MRATVKEYLHGACRKLCFHLVSVSLSLFPLLPHTTQVKPRYLQPSLPLDLTITNPTHDLKHPPCLCNHPQPPSWSSLSSPNPHTPQKIALGSDDNATEHALMAQRAPQRKITKRISSGSSGIWITTADGITHVRPLSTILPFHLLTCPGPTLTHAQWEVCESYGGWTRFVDYYGLKRPWSLIQKREGIHILDTLARRIADRDPDSPYRD